VMESPGGPRNTVLDRGPDSLMDCMLPLSNFFGCLLQMFVQALCVVMWLLLDFREFAAAHCLWSDL